MSRLLQAARRRLPTRATFAPFDAALYRKLHPDVADLPDAGALRRHWLNRGRVEGRLGSLESLTPPGEPPVGVLPADFDLDGYRAENPDLAGLRTTFELVGHYLRFGRREGRRYYPHDRARPSTLAHLASDVERHPDCVVARKALATAERETSDLDGLIATLRPLPRLSPGEVEAAALLTRALHLAGARGEAARVSAAIPAAPQLSAAERAALAIFGEHMRRHPWAETGKLVQAVGDRFDWISASRTAAEISAAITAGRGFALARIGETQGLWAAAPVDAPFASLLAFGRASAAEASPAPMLTTELVQAALDASLSADICGAPTQADIERAYIAGGLASGPALLRALRGLLTRPLSPAPLIADMDVAAELHRKGLLVPILRRSGPLTVISARAEEAQALGDRFRLEVADWLAAPLDAEAHRGLLQRLSATRPGRLTLIADTPLGALYADVLKRSGGIALDLGSFSALLAADMLPSVYKTRPSR
jgi:hypothetical protein